MVRIERMTEETWPAVRCIHAEGIATGDATFAVAPDASYAAFAQGKMACGRLVALMDDAVVGWAALSETSTRECYVGVAEVSIYIAEAARGQGVGKALMRDLIRQADAASVWTLQASIFPENEASLQLHAKHGFRTVGTRTKIGKMTYGQRRGEWRDTVILERRSETVW
jgi:L-amino acid N-acyltransferase YncA